ncbi:hypothetical protein HPB50_007611 [Hyalomma asiaticum]|uniref:Uncharacterized protein n=1 Tax=Hyalomma asiaticum TaxID=266040 RepID=A0ACB7SC77_HYAAI|nr:hypothetical protein HPB50_007611 [Hyalomma asiaticum]
MHAVASLTEKDACCCAPPQPVYSQSDVPPRERLQTLASKQCREALQSSTARSRSRRLKSLGAAASIADSEQGAHERRLLTDLLANYNTLERPVLNESEPLILSFGLTLQQIIDVVSGRATRLARVSQTRAPVSEPCDYYNALHR